MPQCYHIFSNSRDVYLPKNHYEPSSPEKVPTNPTGSWTNKSCIRGYMIDHIDQPNTRVSSSTREYRAQHSRVSSSTREYRAQHSRVSSSTREYRAQHSRVSRSTREYRAQHSGIEVDTLVSGPTLGYRGRHASIGPNTRVSRSTR